MFPAWILICCNVFTFRTSEKRVSSVVISSDGLYVTFADKFGVVWLVTLGEQVSVDNKPLSILGHYCSIITSMVRTST
jgi:tRNA (guanine-N(7)-)-methyltransferase subunit TRM82